MPTPPSIDRGPHVALNPQVESLEPSATLVINEASNARIEAGLETWKFGLGQSPFPVPDVVVQALIAHAGEKDYLPVRGLEALREAVANYHNRREGLTRSAADVLVGPGSKELLFLIQLAYRGDLVIPTPSWVSYAPQAQIIGRDVHWIPTSSEDAWRLSPEALDAHCRAGGERPRLLILNYPNNPTGASYTSAELESLADVAQTHRMIIVSDEIYGDMHHRGEHVSIARHYPEGTIISGGISKWCGAGGWRLGTFTFPPAMRWLLDAMAAIASETFTSTSAPIQYAAIRAFEGGPEIERYLRDSRRLLDSLSHAMAETLESAEIRIAPWDGGFYFLLDFSAHAARLESAGIHTSATLCRDLLDKTGVAILPGSDFGRPPEELTARLAYDDFDGVAALERVAQQPGSGRLDRQALTSICERCLEGASRIARWIQST